MSDCSLNEFTYRFNCDSNIKSLSDIPWFITVRQGIVAIQLVHWSFQQPMNTTLRHALDSGRARIDEWVEVLLAVRDAK